MAEYSDLQEAGAPVETVAELPPAFEPGTADAVAYCGNSRSRAYELVRRIPEELRQARRLKYGFLRRTAGAELPLAGFRNHGADRMIIPLFYGAEELWPEDYTWANASTDKNAPLFVGTLTDKGRAKMMAAAAKIEVEEKASIARMDAESRGDGQAVRAEKLHVVLERSRMMQFCTGYAGLVRMAGASVSPVHARELTFDELSAFAELSQIKTQISAGEFCRVAEVPPEGQAFTPGVIPPADMKDFEEFLDCARAAVVRVKPKGNG